MLAIEQLPLNDPENSSADACQRMKHFDHLVFVLKYYMLRIFTTATWFLFTRSRRLKQVRTSAASVVSTIMRIQQPNFLEEKQELCSLPIFGPPKSMGQLFPIKIIFIPTQLRRTWNNATPFHSFRHTDFISAVGRRPIPKCQSKEDGKNDVDYYRLQEK